MPEQGYTVSPVITSDEVDGHQIVDFSVSTNRHGNNTDISDFQVDQSHGNVTNNYADLEFDRGEQVAPDIEFRNAIHEVYPLFNQALSWAGKGGLSQEDQENFDSVMTGDDITAMYPAIESLIGQFQETGKARAPRNTAPQQQQRQQYQEPLPEEYQVSEPNDAYQEIFGSMFDGADVDLAEDYEDQARQQQAEGDHIGAYMSAGLAAYHDGEVSGRDVVNAVMDKFGMEAATAFFREITGN